MIESIKSMRNCQILAYKNIRNIRGMEGIFHGKGFLNASFLVRDGVFEVIV